MAESCILSQATEATRVLQKELREADCDGDGLIDLQVAIPHIPQLAI
jgi:hypothetical protein